MDDKMSETLYLIQKECLNMHVLFVIVQNFAKLNPVILNIECVLIQFLEL